jgi:excisionase family DNA binding protein
MSQDATNRDVMTMTPEEIAQRLGISAWWVREQIRRGRVPHLRFGRRRIALLPAHVDAIIELVTVEPAGWQGDGESDGGASGSGGGTSGTGHGASGTPPTAPGTASGDLTALHPTDRSVRAHRRRPHVQGDGRLF